MGSVFFMYLWLQLRLLHGSAAPEIGRGFMEAALRKPFEVVSRVV
jgi:hypothetical protein